MGQTTTSILKKAEPEKIYGSTISKIASQFYFVNCGESIHDLGDALLYNEDIMALGIVDSNDDLVGIIERLKLFALLSRPFGRDVLKRKKISEIMEQTQIFDRNENIFTVANDILDGINASANSYFLLKNNEGRFGGIFSSKDLLLYLSSITTQDIDLARVLQQRLVKERDEICEGNLEILSFSKCAKGVGGDFYYIKKISGSKWLINLCDVSGKGVAASLVNTMLWGMVTMNDWKSGLPAFIQKLNGYIVQSFHMEKYLTGIFAFYDEKNGKLCYCDMGHSHMLLYREDKLFKIKSKKSNFPIGIEVEINPHLYNLNVNCGDILFMHTDGLVEQEDVNGQEYSLTRIENILRNNKEKSLNDTADLICLDFAEHHKGIQQHDDYSFILLRRRY